MMTDKYDAIDYVCYIPNEDLGLTAKERHEAVQNTKGIMTKRGALRMRVTYDDNGVWIEGSALYRPNWPRLSGNYTRTIQ